MASEVNDGVERVGLQEGERPGEPRGDFGGARDDSYLYVRECRVHEQVLHLFGHDRRVSCWGVQGRFGEEEQHPNGVP